MHWLLHVPFAQTASLSDWRTGSRYNCAQFDGYEILQRVYGGSTMKLRVHLIVLLSLAGLLTPALARAQSAVDWYTANGAVQHHSCSAVTPNASHIATCSFTSNVTSGDLEAIIATTNSATIVINSASNLLGTCTKRVTPTNGAPNMGGFTCTATSTGAETISVTLA